MNIVAHKHTHTTPHVSRAERLGTFGVKRLAEQLQSRKSASIIRLFCAASVVRSNTPEGLTFLCMEELLPELREGLQT